MTPISKRDPEATRTAILEAAEAIFLAKGFGQTATSEIARAAGVTKSLIHHHFGSKKELWDDVKTHRMGAYAAEQMELFEGSQPDADLLRNSLTGYFRFLEANPETVRMVTWMALEGEDDGCRGPTQELMQAALAKLQAGQEEGFLRSDVEPHSLLFLFLAVTQHWFHFRDHFVHDCGLEMSEQDLNDRYLADILRLFFGGVLPRKD